MGLRDWWQDVREIQEHERKAAAAADAAFDREFAAAAEAGQLPPGWSTADLYELRRERQAAELATARALAQEPRPVDMERDLEPRAEGAMQIANPQAFAPPRALQIGIREWMEPGDFELQAVDPETGEAVDDTGGNPMDPYPTADNFRGLSRDELETKAQELAEGITWAGGEGSWAKLAEGELHAVNERIAQLGIEEELAEHGYAADTASGHDQDVQDRVRGWAAERGVEPAELTPEEWERAEADTSGEEGRRSRDMASQEFAADLEATIERGDYLPRDVTAEMEAVAESQSIEQHDDREDREHWGVRDSGREFDDPEVDHEELINPHGVIGGEEAERATEARAAADLVDREEPLRSHPTVDWTIFHGETAAPQHQHEAERGLEMEM
jgi:hypothetical protein